MARFRIEEKRIYELYVEAKDEETVRRHYEDEEHFSGEKWQLISTEIENVIETDEEVA